MKIPCKGAVCCSASKIKTLTLRLLGAQTGSAGVSKGGTARALWVLHVARLHWGLVACKCPTTVPYFGQMSKICMLIKSHSCSSPISAILWFTVTQYFNTNKPGNILHHIVPMSHGVILVCQGFAFFPHILGNKQSTSWRKQFLAFASQGESGVGCVSLP